MFEFADGFLRDDAPLLSFIPEFKIVGDDIRAHVASYEFTLANDWWAINELPLYLPTYTKLMVHSYLKSLIIFLNLCELYLLLNIMKNNYFPIIMIQHCI